MASLLLAQTLTLEVKHQAFKACTKRIRDLEVEATNLTISPALSCTKASFSAVAVELTNRALSRAWASSGPLSYGDVAG